MKMCNYANAKALTICRAALLVVLLVTSAYCAGNESSTGYADGREQVKAQASFGQPPSADAPYRNPALDVEARIDDLLPRLTDEEKMQLIHSSSSMCFGHLPRVGLACFRSPDAGGGPRAEERPGITYFPSPIAYAAAFDRDLAFKIGRAMGEETRGVYPAAEAGPNGTARMLLGPGVNIARTPLGARNFEYFGEDPRLTGETAAAWIAGLQSVKVAPCMKHYCFNDQEADRTLIDVECGDRAAREIYIRPFEIAVKKCDPWAFMNSYNKYRGKWTSHSAYLNDILCKEYGATGAMIPDWGGVHGMPEAINGGTSIQSSTKVDPARDRRELKLLAEGKIDRARFDDAVRRALRLYFRTGAFDADDEKERALQKRCEASFRSQEHQDLARRAAEEGFVMVKNDGLLPFGGKTVAVVGPLADVRHAMGDKDTNLRLHGVSGAVKAAREITPLEGFRAVFGADRVITGANAAEVAAKADIVVYCGGMDHGYDREVIGFGHRVPNDRPDLLLQKIGMNGKVQEDEILEIAKVNPNVVVMLNGGAPLSVEKWHESVRAIFVTWYGGEFGGEVFARMVKGEVNPSGRLPYTYGRDLNDWPAHKLGELSYPGVWPEPVVRNGKEDKGAPRQEYLDGIWVGYRGFDKYGVTPRYPFGFGLSYTTWEVKCCQCENVANTNVANDQLELDIGTGNTSTLATLITVRVTNTGKMAGRRAVLLFASKPTQPDAEMPPKELVAFDSVNLGPGESTTVEFKLGFEELKYWSEAKNSWQMPKGEVVFYAQ